MVPQGVRDQIMIHECWFILVTIKIINNSPPNRFIFFDSKKRSCHLLGWRFCLWKRYGIIGLPQGLNGLRIEQLGNWKCDDAYYWINVRKKGSHDPNFLKQNLHFFPKQFASICPYVCWLWLCDPLMLHLNNYFSLFLCQLSSEDEIKQI